MKYKVSLEISYMTATFLFDDRKEALDFMETAWTHKAETAITGAKLTFVEEA